MPLTNAYGVIGKSFQIGLGPNSAMLEYDVHDDKALHISAPLDLGEKPVRSQFEAKSVFDLVNLGTINEMQAELYRKAIEYANLRITEVLSAGDGSGPATAGNLMLMPSVYTKVQEERVSLGTLKNTKFIDHIVFEVTETFKTQDGTRYEAAFGTTENPEEFSKFFEVTGTGSKSFPVMKTLTDDTEILMTVRKMAAPVSPDGFKFEVYNNYEAVATTMNVDATGIVVFIDLQSDTIPKNQELSSVLWPGLSDSGFYEFGFNFPTIKGHHYRIHEHNNPTLKNQSTLRPVSCDGGVWCGTDELVADGSSDQFYFLLQPAENAKEYVHFLIYDLDGDRPDVAYMAFHVHNRLGIKKDTPVNPGEQATYETPGPVIIDRETLIVDETGKLSIPMATPEEVRDLCRSTLNAGVNSNEGSN